MTSRIGIESDTAAAGRILRQGLNTAEAGAMALGQRLQPGLEQAGRVTRDALALAWQRSLYWLGCSTIRLLAWTALDMDVHWHASLPPGAKILAPNHPTTTDPFYLLTLTSEPVSVLVTEAAFQVPGFGPYLHHAGHLPAVRDSAGATVEALRRRLAAGQAVAIFPEGALSPAPGSLHPPHSGVARLALASGAPVIPVGIGLAWNRVRPYRPQIAGQTEDGRLYLAGPYAVTVGRPLFFQGDPADRPRVRAVAAEIMANIACLARESQARVARRRPAPRLAILGSATAALSGHSK